MEKSLHQKIAQNVSNLLETHFGENPAAIEVIIEKPFVIIYLKEFMLPGERILLKKQEEFRVLKTRELILDGMKEEMRSKLEEYTGFKLDHLYADWNLAKASGILVGVVEATGEDPAEIYSWPDNVKRQDIENEIISASEKTQRIPDFTKAYCLNRNIIVVERKGILVEIEKELVQLGCLDELKIAKRKLEQKYLGSSQFETLLSRKVVDWFVDWNFENETAYMMILTE